MSGKTEELIARLRTLERVEKIRVQAAARDSRPYQERLIGVYKHHLDTRYFETKIATHSGVSIDATAVSSATDLLERVRRDGARIVFCDEVQFFMEHNDYGYEIIQVLTALLQDGRQIVVSGLDKDFRGLPFGPMGDILALADERVSLTSTCVRCGAPAVLPQRLINGKPAAWDDPVVFPGAIEVYEPRCRRCHEIASHSETFFSPSSKQEAAATSERR